MPERERREEKHEEKEEDREKKKLEELHWDPSMPLPDDEDETDTQRRARAEARKAYLIGEFGPPEAKKREKRRLWG